MMVGLVKDNLQYAIQLVVMDSEQELKSVMMERKLTITDAKKIVPEQ